MQANDTLKTTIYELCTKGKKRIKRGDLFPRLGDVRGADVDAALEELFAEGKLTRNAKGRLITPESAGLTYARVQATGSGYAFLVWEGSDKDALLTGSDTSGALHGDMVLARIKPHGDGRFIGEVERIARRANETVVGTYHCGPEIDYVLPADKRIHARFRVRTRFSRGAQEDDQVVVRVVNWAEEEIEARVVEVLGARGDAKAQLRTVIRAQGLADEFSGEAMAEADAAPLSVVERDTQGREDLRAQACVTIDGPTAKDFDDAVFAETIDGGWRLYVHIADVSHYVKEHSALDRDAYERATSVYLLDTVLPMLPEQLSNGICSLNPGEDRLAFTCVMDIDRNSGEARDYRLARTVIRSDGRLLYDEVSAALEGDVAMRDKLAKHLPTLREMEAVAAALERRRVKRGSIDFALPEADIRLDEHGKAISIEPAQRGVANRIIEECMLMANETVAMHAANLELPFLYRVHEDPDPEKIRRFAELATNLGHKLVIGKPSVHPKHLRALLEEMEGSPEEPMLSTLMLRSLQRARYDTRNLGHFGLALRDYCHFTSPIRRYPDLFIHRVLGEHLAKGLSEERAAHYADVAAEAALHASERERAAAEAEMRYDDVKKAEYMQDKVGERFEGIIAGMSNSGLFIDLPNTVTGFTPLRAMRDDHYYYEEERYRIVGRSTKKVFRLGDRVAV